MEITEIYIEITDQLIIRAKRTFSKIFQNLSKIRKYIYARIERTKYVCIFIYTHVFYVLRIFFAAQSSLKKTLFSLFCKNITVRKRIFFSPSAVFFFIPHVLLPSCILSKPEAWTSVEQLISFNGRESSLDAVIKWNRPPASPTSPVRVARTCRRVQRCRHA